LNPKETAMYMAEDKFRSGHFVYRVAILVPALLLLAFIAQGVFRVGSPPSIKIEPGMPAVGKRTPIKIEVSEPRRGLTHVKVEFRQGDAAATLADKSYPFNSQFSFWGSKTDKDALSVEAGRQVLPGLTGGHATIRVIADRAGTWLRHPGPKVEEITLPVRLTPICSSRRSARGRLVVSRISAAWGRETGSVCPFRCAI
jgi:hypothetical protein